MNEKNRLASSARDSRNLALHSPERKPHSISLNQSFDLFATEEDLCASIVSCQVQSFDGSSGLFSFGFTVERTTMNLFSRSNQNGAPRETAKAVSSHPNK